MVGEIEKVLAALERAEVRYLVVGGVAVVLHGFLRTTADLDLVVQLEPANVRRAINALTDLGYRPRAPVPATSFADSETRERWVREKNLRVFSLWTDAGPLEVSSPRSLSTSTRSSRGRCGFGWGGWRSLSCHAATSSPSSGAPDGRSTWRMRTGSRSSETMATSERNSALPEDYDWSFEAHRRRQTRRGLEMTPAERLRWLEETMEELRAIQGRAAVRATSAGQDRTIPDLASSIRRRFEPLGGAELEIAPREPTREPPDPRR